MKSKGRGKQTETVVTSVGLFSWFFMNFLGIISCRRVKVV